jgi:hypothetical protein
VRDQKRTKRNFSVTQYAAEDKGKKIIIYSETNMGKTTLAGMAPRPVFVCPDRGLEDLDHPRDGQWDVITGVDTWDDIRDVSQDLNVLANHDTLVFDTATVIQNRLCVDWVVRNIKKEKGGVASSITNYGYGKGYEHVFNNMLLWQGDLDRIVESGKNVIILCQLEKRTETDPEYGEYWKSYPDLYEKGNAPVSGCFTAWANYVFKIGWDDVEINEDKIAETSDFRAIYFKPKYSHIVKYKSSAFDEYDTVDFDNKNDDSLWKIMFGDDYNG